MKIVQRVIEPETLKPAKTLNHRSSRMQIFADWTVGRRCLPKADVGPATKQPVVSGDVWDVWELYGSELTGFTIGCRFLGLKGV